MKLVSHKPIRSAGLIFLAVLCALLAPTRTAFAAGTNYEAHVLADSPFINYRFGEASGTTAIDASANGFNGTYFNSPTLGVAGDSAGGTSDNAVAFVNTSDQYVLTPDSADGFGADLNTSSFEFVFKTTDTTDEQALVTGENAGSTVAFQVWLNANDANVVTANNIRFFIRDSTGVSFEAAFVNAGAFDGNYHHLVFSWNAGTLNAYLDGVLQTLTTSGTPPTAFGALTTGDPFIFGAFSPTHDDTGLTDYANATLDEAALYTNALSAAQVTIHYDALAGITSAPPVVPTGINDVWKGTVNNNWDTSTANWANSFANIFTNGDTVVFDDSASQFSVNLAANVQPAGMTFSNSSHNYIIDSTGGFSITGSGGLTNAGTGTLTLNNSNAFTGPIVISAGQLVFGSVGQLDAGAYAGNITNNGILTYSSSAAQAFSGVISGSGSLMVSNNAGVLKLNGATPDPFTGAIVVTNGELDLSFVNLSIEGIYLSSGITIDNGGIVQVDVDNSLNGFSTTNASYPPVTINVGGTLTELSTANGGEGASSHISGTLTLNGGQVLAPASAVDAFGNWGIYSNVVVNGGINQSVMGGPGIYALAQTGGTVFNVANGGTASGVDLDVQGPINHTSDPDTGLIKTGAGTMALDALNTYTSFTTISNGTLILNGELQSGNYAAAINNYGTFIDNNDVSQTLSGVVSGSGSLILSNGNLTLSAADTYTGSTIISDGAYSGILHLTGSGSLASTNLYVGSGDTIDVSGLASTTLALGNGQYLEGVGTVNGSVSTISRIYPGTDGIIGSLTINNNLTLGPGATLDFDLSTTYNGANDQIVVGGSLTNSFNAVHIKAPSTSSSLDTTADYILVTTSGGVSGSISGTPVWDVAPVNSTHFVVLVSGNNVVLHYLASGAPTPPSGGISASPTTLTHNQNTVVSVTVTNGTFPISTVILDASSLGDSSSISLVRSNLSNVYTNTVAPASSTGLGSQNLVAVITDNQGNTSLPLSVPVTIVAATEVWDGLGSNNNWVTNPNWTSGSAPGYTGDAVVFAGTTDLTPNMETNYSVTGLTFTNGAGSFNIGSASGSTLTLLAGAGVTNNSTSSETLNVPIALTAAATLSAAAGSLTNSQNITNGTSYLTVAATNNVTINGAIIGTTGGLFKTGAGTLTLTNVNTYGGSNIISGGTLVLTGSGTLVTAGNGTGAAKTLIGNVSGTPAALYQSGGSITTSAGTGGNMQIGGAVGASGYYNLSGGTLNVANTSANGAEINIGGTSGGAGTFGQFDMSGGTVNAGVSTATSGNFFPSRGAAGCSSVVNISGGSLTVFNGMADAVGNGFSANWATGNTNVTTISGSAILTSPSVSFKLSENNNAANVGILNLNGGTLQTLDFFITGNASAVVNFNGGTLKAGNLAEPLFMGNVASVYDYSGGATIDDNGTNITITQAFLAPPGNGITTIPVATGGVSYVMPPRVAISDTTGSGATAYATISGGQVTGIVVTCPGRNYTSPTVTLVGGGFTTAATLNPATISANASGGLTKEGSGTLIMSATATNTYAGTTTVGAGTLIFSAAQPNTSPVVVNDGATFGVSAYGSSHFSPTSLTLGSSAGASLDFAVNSTTQAPLTPVSFTQHGNYTINILAGSFVIGGSYPLVTLPGTPSGYTLGTLPSGVGGNLTTAGHTISLTVTAVTNTIWTAAVNGTWDINTTANWTFNGTAGNYIDGSLVQFDDTATSFTVTNSAVVIVSPASILVTNNANNYVIGTNILISGLSGITKNGTGTLTLGAKATTGTATAWTYTGPTVVNGGTLALNFGNTGISGIYTSSGLIINTNGTVQTVNNNGLAGSATPIGSLPVAVNAGGILEGTTLSDSSHIRGLLTLNGGTLGDLGTGNQGAFGTWDIDDGVVVNGGTITSTMSALDMIADMTGGSIFNVANGGTSSGIDLNVTGTFETGSSQADTGIIKTGGGTMALAGTNTYTHFTTVNNGILMLAGNGNLGSSVYNAVITNNATFVDNSAKVQVLGGVIYGTGTLAMSNAAAVLKLAGTNIYTGPTIIGAGTLALTNAGSITGSTSIQVSSGAILDVSKSVSGLTLVSGQTLTGSGVVDGNVTNAASSTIAPGGASTAGTLTVTNIVTMGGNTLMVVNSGGSSSELVATNITYGGTLTLNNVGPAYAAGNSFTLFSAVNYSGAFASIFPATPGAGLAWNTNALNTNGVLSVISTGPGIFTNKTGITSFSLNGANVVITATNGQAGDAYYLLESTNVAKPISQWVPVATNVLGANGNYSFTGTNVVTPGSSQQFYILSNTNN